MNGPSEEVRVEIMDFDAPWGPEDCGALLERVPAFIALDFLRECHTAVHRVCQDQRRAAKRRPWRWHRLRALKARERELCAETSRRSQLVVQVYNAHAAGDE